MATAIQERPRTVNFEAARESAAKQEFEPNFGPEDVHAIRAIAFIVNGIILTALVMYSTITFFAWLGWAR